MNGYASEHDLYHNPFLDGAAEGCGECARETDGEIAPCPRCGEGRLLQRMNEDGPALCGGCLNEEEAI